MGQRALVKNSNNKIQSKRRELQLRREKEHALAQYKRVAKQTGQKKKTLASKEPVSVNHAIFFTVCLGVASVVVPQLASLALIFSILIVGQLLGVKFDMFEKKEEQEVRVHTEEESRMLRMIKPEVVKLSSKKKVELPISKSTEGLTFKGEDGGTITQFDWRQLTE